MASGPPSLSNSAIIPSLFLLPSVILYHLESPPAAALALYHIESPPPAALALYHIESPWLGA